MNCEKCLSILRAARPVPPSARRDRLNSQSTWVGIVEIRTWLLRLWPEGWPRLTSGNSGAAIRSLCLLRIKPPPHCVVFHFKRSSSVHSLSRSSNKKYDVWNLSVSASTLYESRGSYGSAGRHRLPVRVWSLSNSFAFCSDFPGWHARICQGFLSTGVMTDTFTPFQPCLSNVFLFSGQFDRSIFEPRSITGEESAIYKT